MTDAQHLVAISVGNSRTQVGRFVEGALVESVHLPNGDLPTIVDRVTAWCGEREAAIAIASVNAPVSKRLASALEDQLSTEVFAVGPDVPIPIAERLDPETITGADRLLNAAAAYETVQQACIIIDAGSAVTVDFVDGEGTFHGGAILPGARMQLRALHEHTAGLPEIEFERPDDEYFGRSTSQAMLHGVYHGLRGMVWRLVERYAEGYGAYPIVLATGGDAALLFEGDELIDRIVPELTLFGIRAAVRFALRAGDADADVTQ